MFWNNLSYFGYNIKMTFYVISDFCQIFPDRAPCRDIFSKIGMGNVRGITKNVPKLQIYEHTPVTNLNYDFAKNF